MVYCGVTWADAFVSLALSTCHFLFFSCLLLVKSVLQLSTWLRFAFLHSNASRISCICFALEQSLGGSQFRSLVSLVSSIGEVMVDSMHPTPPSSFEDEEVSLLRCIILGSMPVEMDIDTQAAAKLAFFAAASILCLPQLQWILPKSSPHRHWALLPELGQQLQPSPYPHQEYVFMGSGKDCHWGFTEVIC